MVELVNAENIVPLLVRSVRSIDHGQLQFEVSPIAHQFIASRSAAS